jgi:PAS domain S-box-containing protein
LPLAVWKALDDAGGREAREQSEEALALLDAAAQAIIGLDREGRCTFCNPACLRLLRYSDRGDLLGKDIHSVCHPTRSAGGANHPDECSACQAFRKNEEIHIENELLRRADGTSLVTEFWSYPMLRDGEVAGAVVTFLDRTHSKTGGASGERMRHASHEFRTAMNGIMGMAQLVLETELTAEQRDYMESVKTSADLLLNTVNDIVKWSGLDPGAESESDPVRPA